LRWSGSAQLRTELCTALTKTGWVARVGADRLFATLPTAVAAYESGSMIIRLTKRPMIKLRWPPGTKVPTIDGQ
jgi:hypothetical protein